MKNLEHETGPKIISSGANPAWDKIRRSGSTTGIVDKWGCVTLIDDKGNPFKIWSRAGFDFPDSDISIGAYTIRMLGDLKVVQPSDIRLVENIQVCRALNRGYLVPQTDYASKIPRWQLGLNMITTKQLDQELMKDPGERAFLKAMNNLRQTVVKVDPQLVNNLVIRIEFTNRVPLDQDFVVIGRPLNQDDSLTRTLLPRQIIYPLELSEEKS